jgi:hypothetical protein
MFQECRHIMPSGSRCHAAALREMPYCYFHATLHRRANRKNRPASEPLQIPVLEDAGAIQIALSQIVDALGSSRIDPRRAALLLSAIRVAASVIPRSSADNPASPVRAFSCEDDGEVLAPEQSVCEPPADCRTCPRQNTCDRFEETDEDEEAEQEEEYEEQQSEAEEENEGDEEQDEDEDDEEEILDDEVDGE